MTAFQATSEKSQTVLGESSMSEAMPQPSVPDEIDHRTRWLTLPELWLDPAYLRSRRIVTVSSDVMAAPYDILRTRLVQVARKEKWHKIAIVSPSKGSGKTTLLVNMSFSLASQTKLRTMVLDFDLRNPEMSRILGARVPLNFFDVIRRQGYAETLLRRHGENLAFGMNDGSVPGSSEILQSNETSELIDELKDHYALDLVIFDLPDMGSADDAYNFLPQVDAALIVVEAGRQTSHEVDVFEREVAKHTNVIGIVLTKCVSSNYLLS